MRVLITDDEVGARLIEQRRASGLDTFDEVWEGVYRVVPARSQRHGKAQASVLMVLREWTWPRGGEQHQLVVTGPVNIGTSASYRVPDGAVLVDGPDDDLTFLPTAQLVVEVLSPGDDTYGKFDFYLECGVREILVVDPQTRTLELHASGRGPIGYVVVDDSNVLDLDNAAGQIRRAMGW